MTEGPIVVLRHAVPLEINAQRVRVAFDTGSFYARKAAGDDVGRFVADASERMHATRPSVEIVQAALPEDAPTLARRADTERTDARNAREEQARNHPVVRSVLAVLGGEVRSVRLDEA